MKKIAIYGIILILLPISVIASKKYELTCDRELLRTACEVAKSQLGVREQSNCNDGEVLKYLRAVGLEHPAPYCAAGIWWSFAEACRLLGRAGNCNPLPRTALANAMFNYAKLKGTPSKFSPNDCDLIVWRKDGSFRGHIEIIISTERAGFVQTVGFNTRKVLGNRTFEGVFLQRRNILHPLCQMRVGGIIGFKQV